MKTFGINIMLALALMILTPVALMACGSNDAGTGTASAQVATMDHGDHGDHGDHAAHADHADHKGHENHGGTAMGGMGGDKVDPEGAVKAFDHKPKTGEKAICPVSGDVFIVADDTLMSEHDGKHYAFCCPGCKPRFDANPGAFAG